MKFGTIGDFVAHLATMNADIEAAREAAVVKGCKLIARKAKGMIGHEQPFWPALAESTIEDKRRHGYRVPAPLLRTGEMRASISWSAPYHEGNEIFGYVGSDNLKAKWHELGTEHVPPRPFLSVAAAASVSEIGEIAGRLMFGAIVHGGPHYRELRELGHLLHGAAENVKEIFDEDNDGEPGASAL